nr:immunoglobulin heavy chain junction region [Macaca mulatta]MOX38028.1 immunoglobulin heavy chain junction region [Macaca mulatta]MOX38190.1 immunoglobulin heavy chain junction region [Macaca mulatta]MOX38226.1 immunoglobulin heavy chain junction region [Macaca mulatta]MOX38227.1 immunoglobulin heavy chain junction region [Macaca mulatta]
CGRPGLLKKNYGLDSW